MKKPKWQGRGKKRAGVHAGEDDAKHTQRCVAEALCLVVCMGTVDLPTRPGPLPVPATTVAVVASPFFHSPNPALVLLLDLISIATAGTNAAQLLVVQTRLDAMSVQIRPYSSLLWLRRCGFLRARAGDRRTPSLAGVARARRVDAHELQATLWHGFFPAKHLDHKPALCLSQILLKLGMERSSAKPSARPNKASGAGRRRYVTVSAFYYCRFHNLTSTKAFVAVFTSSVDTVIRF